MESLGGFLGDNRHHEGVINEENIVAGDMIECVLVGKQLT
jgi:hypothetical protein